MVRFLTDNNLVLDETEDFERVEIPRVERGVVVDLVNEGGRGVDDSEFHARFRMLHGARNITSVIINDTSRLVSLQFLDALPSLRMLTIYSSSLETLEGIEKFAGTLKVVTKSSARDLGRIGEAPISKLILQWEHQRDLDAIAKNRSIRYLHLERCPVLDPGQLRRVPIEELFLAKCGFVEFGGTSQMKALVALTLGHCSKLERFTGDNSLVKSLTIDVCGRIDVASCRTFPALRNLSINTKREISLRSLAGFARLETLALRKSKVRFDTLNLECPKLKDLWIDPMPKERMIEVSQANPGVLVNVQYRDGVKVEH